MFDSFSSNDYRDFNAFETSTSSDGLNCFAYNPKLSVMMVMFKGQGRQNEAYFYKINHEELLEFLQEAIKHCSWGLAYMRKIRGEAPAFSPNAGNNIMRCKVPDLQWLSFMDEEELIKKFNFNMPVDPVYDVKVFYKWLITERWIEEKCVDWSNVAIDPAKLIDCYSF